MVSIDIAYIRKINNFNVEKPMYDYNIWIGKLYFLIFEKKNGLTRYNARTARYTHLLDRFTKPTRRLSAHIKNCKRTKSDLLGLVRNYYKYYCVC